jgi:membrane protease YdiL (CAAX protease family)
MQQRAQSTQEPNRGSARSEIEWRNIGIFTAITFGLSWGTWGVVYLSGGIENLPVFTAGSLLAMWGPGVSAILCSRYISPTTKRELGLRVGILERYVSIYFFVLLFLVAAMILSVVLGFQEINRTLEPLSSEIADAPYPFNDPILIAFLTIVGSFTIAAAANSLFAFGEELGWRGFLHAKLAPLGLGRASLLVGVIWGVWHAPAIFMGYNYPDNPAPGVFLMVWFTVGWSVILTWLRHVTGSVLAAAFGHGLINAVAGLPLLLLLDANALIRAPLGISGLIPLSLLAAFAYGLLRRSEQASRSE